MLRFVFVMVIALAETPVMAAVLTGPVINPANGNLYYLLETDSWADSQAEAISLGGNLVTINDAAEDLWVSATFGSFDGQSRNLWIGLNDSFDEGTFVWADGDPVAYTNWDIGQPDDNSGIDGMSQDFVRIRSDNLRWDDVNEADAASGALGTVNGVVEVAVPEPLSLALIAAAMLTLALQDRR